MKASSFNLDMPIEHAYAVGPIYARRLAKLGIATIYDLLTHFPSRHVDFSLITPIVDVQAGEVVTIQGSVLEITNEYSKTGKKIQRALVADKSASIECVWFNQPYLVRALREGTSVSLSGRADWFRNKVILNSPEFEILKDKNYALRSSHGEYNLDTIHTGRLVPIYPETSGVSSKWLRSRIAMVLPNTIHEFAEYLSQDILNVYHLITLEKAIKEIHFPQNQELLEKAKKRLSYDELLFVQLHSLAMRRNWESEKLDYRLSISKFKHRISDFWRKLPFSLTRAQQKAVSQIFADLNGVRPMNRLLEGDVGSGKTVVAAIAMYVAYLNDFQSAFMAPTEILAQQHYKTINSLLAPLGVKVELKTRSTPKQASRSTGNIIIGTHALLAKKIRFDKLALVVIDEQHRFGVEQRAVLRQKGLHPHLLTMTATPIPRTVMLTLYGQLDLSYLDELPAGRKDVKTYVVAEAKRPAAYAWIRRQIMNKAKVFVICPLVEESSHESLKAIKAVTKEYTILREQIFNNFQVELLHGRLPASKKTEILSSFREGATQVLVATPVVEVGIDIPGATLIIIEDAERFGLAQLHQLRGRVGRGDKQSYCLLFTKSREERVISRLKSLERMHLGSELAELDLKIRGPGEIFGTKQHGVTFFKIADISDRLAIRDTTEIAKTLFAEGFNLIRFSGLNNRLQRSTIKIVVPD